MCVVLKMVDSFLSYSQRDKIAVFFSLSKILQFCFISLSGLGVLVLGRSKPNRNKLMRRSSKLCMMAAHLSSHFFVYYVPLYLPKISPFALLFIITFPNPFQCSCLLVCFIRR